MQEAGHRRPSQWPRATLAGPHGPAIAALPAVPGHSRSRRLSLACLASLAWAWPALCSATGAQRRPWPHQRVTPPLQLPSHGGATWDLAAAQGQAVLLNFWASWCEPCRAEMPALQALARQHQAAGLRVVTVNFRESEAAVRRFVASTPLDLPILLDADGAAARAFGVRIFPTTVAVARNGRAAFSVVGEADWAAQPAQQWVTSLLGRPRPVAHFTATHHPPHTPGDQA